MLIEALLATHFKTHSVNCPPPPSLNEELIYYHLNQPRLRRQGGTVVYRIRRHDPHVVAGKEPLGDKHYVTGLSLV